MEPTYVSVTVDLPEGEAEALQDLLHERGAAGLEVRDREGPAMPGVRVPATGEAIVIGYFDDPSIAQALPGEIAEAFPSSRVAVQPVENQDWSESWKALIRSVEVGRLWVGPPWMVADAPAGKERIVIEPKMAFGTGDHPTTSLCLEAVDAFMAANPGADVLDVGTGTGVLAIAARRLGAQRVVGVDNDPVSVVLAKENAAQNGTPEVALSEDTLDRIDGTFDLVVANILANTLVELAPLITGKVAKQLVLAGVLVHQRDQVEGAYLAQGLVSAGGKTQGEWVRIDLRRP